ncbi:hypothetical protein JHW43_000860 [Diplocarpon mali]|nr:hypothetical protein JHW43_000860 [Diplocarpon mali]
MKQDAACVEFRGGVSGTLDPASDLTESEILWVELPASTSGYDGVRRNTKPSHAHQWGAAPQHRNSFRSLQKPSKASRARAREGEKCALRIWDGAARSPRLPRPLNFSLITPLAKTTKPGYPLSTQPAFTEWTFRVLATTRHRTTARAYLGILSGDLREHAIKRELWKHVGDNHIQHPRFYHPTYHQASRLDLKWGAQSHGESRQHREQAKRPVDLFHDPVGKFRNVDSDHP